MTFSNYLEVTIRVVKSVIKERDGKGNEERTCLEELIRVAQVGSDIQYAQAVELRLASVHQLACSCTSQIHKFDSHKCAQREVPSPMPFHLLIVVAKDCEEGFVRLDLELNKIKLK